MYQATFLTNSGSNGRFTFLEGARWHDKRFWFVDLYTDSIYSMEEDGSGLQLEADVPGVPCGLGWLPDGRLIAVAIDSQRIVRRESDGEVVTHADLRSHLVGDGDGPNDMVVTKNGDAYVGTFGFDARGGAPFSGGPLLRVTVEGAVSVVSEPLYFPNGMTVVDGTLVVAETFGNRLSAFDLTADGSLGPRRDWAQMAAVPDTSDLAGIFPQLVVAMDGISDVNEQGGVWVADYVRPRAVRVLPGVGIVDEVVTANGLSCCAVALGGADGRTLLLCTTATDDTNPEVRRAEPMGQLQACRVDVPALERT